MTLPLDISPFFTGSNLSYAAGNLPAGLSITPATGIISGSPTQVETRAVTVTATNAFGSAQQAFTWSIVASASAPAQIADLAATPGDGTVTLSWSAPADNGAAISDYVIERSIGGGAFAVLADGTNAATGFVDTGLGNGVSHAYRVAAVNAAGTGPVSAVASATPAGSAALSVLAFDHAESGAVAQAVNSFAGLTTAAGEVLVAVTHRGSPDDNEAISVDVSGTAATLVARQYVLGQTKQEHSVWRVTHAGSTADVTVTTSFATARIGVAVWSVGAAATVTADSVTLSGVTGIADTVDVAAGGLALAHATAIGSGASFAWTGLGSRFQAEVSSSYWHSAADDAFVTQQTGLSVSAAFGGTFSNTILTVISVSPV